MYGTVARMRVKPGKLDAMRKLTADEDMMSIPGLVSTTVYQLDKDPNELIMAVVFTDKDAYVKNADSPEQNKRYEEFVALLEGAPEWNDGEVIYPEK
ncbi:MAG: putative quinol monooxygenase [Acidimicrobiia bacterium]